MATVTTANKPAPKRAPRKTAVKAVSAPPAPVEDTEADDPQNTAGWTFTRPQGAETFVSTGEAFSLGKLTPRALENLTELALEGNTPQAQAYWTRQLAKHGVDVSTLSVSEVSE